MDLSGECPGEDLVAVSKHQLSHDTVPTSLTPELLKVMTFDPEPLICPCPLWPWATEQQVLPVLCCEQSGIEHPPSPSPREAAELSLKGLDNRGSQAEDQLWEYRAETETWEAEAGEC